MSAGGLRYSSSHPAASSRGPLDPQSPPHRMTSHPTAPHVSPPATLHRLLEQVAERDPAATALVDAEGPVTHGELHRAANRLAHHLRARGVGLETPVAVL